MSIQRLQNSRHCATRSGNAGSCARLEVDSKPSTYSGAGVTKGVGHSCPTQGELRLSEVPVSALHRPEHPSYFARAASHHPQAPPLRSAACGWHPEFTPYHHVTLFFVVSSAMSGHTA